MPLARTDVMFPAIKPDQSQLLQMFTPFQSLSARMRENVLMGCDLMRSPTGRRLALEQVLEQLGGDARQEILGNGSKRSIIRQLEPAIGPRIGENERPVVLNDKAQTLAGRFSKFSDRELIAFTKAMGNGAVAELVQSAVQDNRFHPMKVYQLHKEVRKAFLAQQERSPQNNEPGGLKFSGGVDPFGVTFVVGLATYVYGKLQKNRAAKNLGKTLLLIGVIPNLILLGMAISAFLKVAFNNGFGFF